MILELSPEKTEIDTERTTNASSSLNFDSSLKFKKIEVHIFLNFGQISSSENTGILIINFGPKSVDTYTHYFDGFSILTIEARRRQIFLAFLHRDILENQ